MKDYEVYMKKDFDMIVHKLPRTMPEMNVYPLGDLHVGSREFNTATWRKWVKMVMTDPYGKVVMIGDLMDNGLKSSLTNTYEQSMSPMAQKMWLANELKPLAQADKILGATPGNHEYRTTKVADGCPLYDVMCKLNIEDLYRQNMAFLKMNLGARTADRQYSYTMVLAHGASKVKTVKFAYSIDGMDVFVTGHTHQAGDSFPSKIVMDTKNEVVSQRGFIHLVVPSFQTMGGYGLRGMYAPQDCNKIPLIRFNGMEKGVGVQWI